MTLTVGVDVGGTKIDICVADPLTGVVVARSRIPTHPERSGEDVISDCRALVVSLVAGRSFSSIGIGFCELVDRASRLTSACTLDLLGVDIVSAFSDLAPTTVVSDVRAAALGEARFGAGRGIVDPWIYVSVGTGVSYALVIDGRPFEGARGNAIIVGAPPVERIASGLGIARAAGRSRAEDVLADPACAGVVSTAAASLGAGLAMLANALDPERIVIGGGLGLEASYRESALGAMRELIEAPGTRDVLVVPAGLGDLAGPLGAALAGFDSAVALPG
jgi:glucokinase